jgi:peptide deformylase
MILQIVAFGSPILREKCENISDNYTKLDDLIVNMWETMYNASGVGLAAPQINKAIRLFIIDTNPFIDEENEFNTVPIKKVFINPRIIEEEGEKWDFNEGCLSIPDVREDISRRPTIKLEYFDEYFKRHIEVFDGLTARVIQHEYDHINGILFTDKISPLRKKMIKGKLIDISKGKVSVNYKMGLKK